MTATPSRLFVTGTDTGVGKTLVTLALMQRGRDRGARVVGLKPVASGCQRTARGLENDDAVRLRESSSVRLPYALVNPYAFEPPIAPHLAAEATGTRIEPARIAASLEAAAAVADLVLIEGAGGWLVPLGPNGTLADLVAYLGVPVVVVVGLRLGCLSHALLTAESITARGVRLAGWVASAIDPTMAAQTENIDALRRRLPAPLLGWLPYAPGVSVAELASSVRLPGEV
jgi:dethiobiotin synthetase